MLLRPASRTLKLRKNIRTVTRVKPLIVDSHGISLIHNPYYNKGTGYNIEERNRLSLRGLVPPIQASLHDQKVRILQAYRRYSDPAEAYQYLVALQDRNETLFYSFLLEHIEELVNVLYQPSVIGEVCKNFSTLFRRARGMYFSVLDKGVMNAMVHNWPEKEVELIVVTDGSRILSMGDLGVSGMGVPISKTSLYVACAGIEPRKVLPITLDTGTNNAALRDDPLYLGVKQPRITGEEFYDFVDEFLSAVTNRWPNVLIQFSDFSRNNARPLLEKYRKKHLVFNDDIQGTGALAAAGILGALRVRGSDWRSLANETIVIVGAGNTGIGVANSLAFSMVHGSNIPHEDAFKRLYVLDEFGLLGANGKHQRDSTGYAGERPFVRNDLPDGMPLLDVIKSVKPTILIGLSGQGGVFTEEVVGTMYKNTPRPIIFPLSFPVERCECTAEQAYKWTDGQAIFASSSSFAPVTHNGVTLYPSQANNMFIFAGVGLATTKIKSQRISFGMLNEAAIALSLALSQKELQQGLVYPSIKRIREVSLDVAAAVAQEAYNLGLAQVPRPRKLRAFLESSMWTPEYPDIIHEQF
eukprot:TRINITY_DN3079_c0_g1_i1.p1 TRINITY_DN3079_c0_g1~~TRINITY_DN3079_c0_g1_i1.p1  ORF type:complete len:582 (+),score=109.97 TRINITY_DN3079_c0_g1_i1:19-1764(+)